MAKVYWLTGSWRFRKSFWGKHILQLQHKVGEDNDGEGLEWRDATTESFLVFKTKFTPATAHYRGEV